MSLGPDSNGYLMHFADGPLALRANVQNLAGTPGNLVVKRDHFGWPLPDRLAIWTDGDNVAVLPVDEGDVEPDPALGPPHALYRKVSESQLPDDSNDRVMRGAAYKVET